MSKHLNINSQTKIGELLEVYPQLEDTLLALSPSFAKLKNPILRKTIGRIASLRQVADIGNIEIGELVNTLRKAIGEDTIDTSIPTENSSEMKPKWIDESELVINFDATEIIESGGNPMSEIIAQAKSLSHNQTMLLITPFKPIPILEILEVKNYQTWSYEVDNKIYSYIKSFIF